MTAPSSSFAIKGVPEVIIEDFSTGATYARLLRSVDAKLSFDFPSEDIYGGNGLYPFDTFDKDRKGSISFTNAEFDAGLISATMGGSVTRAGTSSIYVMGEAHTIPASTAYTVDLTNKTTAVAASVKVRYATTGLEFDLVTSDLGTGEFTYASGTCTFAVGDASAAILIDYEYTVADGDVVSVLSNTTIPVVKITMTNTFKDTSGNNTTMTIVVFKAKASGKMDFDQGRGKAATHSLDFTLLDAGRSDKKMVDFYTARLA